MELANNQFGFNQFNSNGSFHIFYFTKLLKMEPKKCCLTNIYTFYNKKSLFLCTKLDYDNCK